MALHASWMHGNALTVEDTSALQRDGHYGWGRDLAFVPGKSSWLHMPLPTPVIVADQRSTVQRFFLLFKAVNVEIRAVHVYDGSGKVQEIAGLSATGEHRTGLDGANTFDLSAPHTVAFGMGITFFVQASIGFDTQISTQLILASAGADFTT